VLSLIPKLLVLYLELGPSSGVLGSFDSTWWWLASVSKLIQRDSPKYLSWVAPCWIISSQSACFISGFFRFLPGTSSLPLLVNLIEIVSTVCLVILFWLDISEAQGTVKSKPSASLSDNQVKGQIKVKTHKSALTHKSTPTNKWTPIHNSSSTYHSTLTHKSMSTPRQYRLVS